MGKICKTSSTRASLKVVGERQIDFDQFFHARVEHGLQSGCSFEATNSGDEIQLKPTNVNLSFFENNQNLKKTNPTPGPSQQKQIDLSDPFCLGYQHKPKRNKAP